MESRLRQIIAARIERELELRGWTRKDLAQKVGMSPGHLNNMMSGEKRFYDQWIDRIAQAFEIPVESFVSEKITYPGMLPVIIQRYVESEEFRKICDAAFLLLARFLRDYKNSDSGTP